MPTNAATGSRKWNNGHLSHLSKAQRDRKSGKKGMAVFLVVELEYATSTILYLDIQGECIASITQILCGREGTRVWRAARPSRPSQPK